MSVTDNGGDKYVPRLVDAVLPEIIDSLPAVRLVGARSTGKTTSASQVAASVVHLDREAEAAAFRIDPDAALARLPRPTLLDEWQDVPGILGAVKRAVDSNPAAGQFILTGSVRLELEGSWPGTGRVVRQAVHGLTQREIAEVTGNLFVERLHDDLLGLADTPPTEWNLFDYLEAAARGGFPDLVLRRAGSVSRKRWLQGYLEDLLTIDVKLTGSNVDSSKLRTFVETLAIFSAQVVEQSTMWDAAGISKQTANVYEDLLESVYFSERVPALRSNRADRLVAMPKRYLLDTALLMYILGVDASQVRMDARLLGSILDTYVAMQLRPELAVQPQPAKMLHLRSQSGRHEVDIVLEFPRGKVVGIEVKATAAPALDDARHLIWMREVFGDDFIGGVVLHTGQSSFVLSPKIVATPIAAIWTP
ncbi:MAG: DUF4143 domain-containing protein [Propionibacteriaceae bacterium]|jgi:predicted AAA+ superfamily ATPase|nr:DUF4143 domain-containing protein [Propionibacteriaceae bacterium]